MIRLDTKHDRPQGMAEATMTLDFDARRRALQRGHLDDGREVALALESGTLLRDGDVVSDAAEQLYVRIVAAAEPLSYVNCADRLQLNRLCYHLGMQRALLQVTCGAVVYRPDEALDKVVFGLGETPQRCWCAFDPDPQPGEPDTGAASAEDSHAAGSGFVDVPRQARA